MPRHLYSLAAAAALLAASPAICCASDGADPNAGGGGGQTPPVNPTPTPTPDPNAEPKAKAAKRVHVIWVAPGYDHAPGTMLRTPKDLAEKLRAAGKAREASDKEVKAAGDDVQDFG